MYIWVKILNLEGKLFYLCTVFINAKAPLITYQTFYDSLHSNEFINDSKITVVGDFNLQINATKYHLSQGDSLRK